MNKKTYDEVKKIFSDNGCILLEEDYINSKYPMCYICVCGKESKISLSSFSQGRRCIDCGGKKKHTYESVKSYFDEQGCILLSKDYINSHEKLEYICSCGTFDSKNFNNFRNGQRCSNCKKNKVSSENHWSWKAEKDSKGRDLIKQSLKCLYSYRNVKSYNLIGYTSNELQERMQLHDNWLNCKDRDWYIDYVFPIKAFVDHGISDLSIINHLDNLKPVLEKSKSEEYSELEFCRWLTKIRQKKINLVCNLSWKTRILCGKRANG